MQVKLSIRIAGCSEMGIGHDLQALFLVKTFALRANFVALQRVRCDCKLGSEAEIEGRQVTVEGLETRASLCCSAPLRQGFSAFAEPVRHS
jgi:hypothetical protein